MVFKQLLVGGACAILANGSRRLGPDANPSGTRTGDNDLSLTSSGLSRRTEFDIDQLVQYHQGTDAMELKNLLLVQKSANLDFIAESLLSSELADPVGEFTSVFAQLNEQLGGKLTLEMLNDAFAKDDYSPILSLVPSAKKAQRAARRNLADALKAFEVLFTRVDEFIDAKHEADTVSFMNRILAAPSGELLAGLKRALAERKEPEWIEEIKQRLLEVNAMRQDAPVQIIKAFAKKMYNARLPRPHSKSANGSPLSSPSPNANPSSPMSGESNRVDLSMFTREEVFEACRKVHAEYMLSYQRGNSVFEDKIAGFATLGIVSFVREIVVRIVMQDFTSLEQKAEIEKFIADFGFSFDLWVEQYTKLAEDADLPAVARQYMKETARMHIVRREAFKFATSRSQTLLQLDASKDELETLLKDKQFWKWIQVEGLLRLRARIDILGWTPESDSLEYTASPIRIGASLEALDTYNPALMGRATLLNHLARQIVGMNYDQLLMGSQAVPPTPDRARTRLIAKYVDGLREIHNHPDVAFDFLRVQTKLLEAQRFWSQVDSAKKSLNECIWARPWGMGYSWFNVDPTFEEDVTETHIMVACTELFSLDPSGSKRHDRFNAFIAAHKRAIVLAI